MMMRASAAIIIHMSPALGRIPIIVKLLNLSRFQVTTAVQSGIFACHAILLHLAILHVEIIASSYLQQRQPESL